MFGGVLEVKSRRSPSVVRRSPSREGIFVTNGMPYRLSIGDQSG